MLKISRHNDYRFGKELSAAEMRVLELVVAGHNSKAISRHLGISPRTVDVHRETMLAKLNARNNAHLAAIAVSIGLVPLELPDWWVEKELAE